MNDDERGRDSSSTGIQAARAVRGELSGDGFVEARGFRGRATTFVVSAAAAGRGGFVAFEDARPAALFFSGPFAFGFVFAREAFLADFETFGGAFFDGLVPFRRFFRGVLFFARVFLAVVAPFRRAVVARFFFRAGFVTFFDFTPRDFVGAFRDFVVGLRDVFARTTFCFPPLWRDCLTFPDFEPPFFFAVFFAVFFPVVFTTPLDVGFLPDVPDFFFAFFRASRDDLLRLAAIF